MYRNKFANVVDKCRRCRVIFWGLLALSVLAVAVAILYQNLFFHNLWIRFLPEETVQAVTIYSKMTGAAVSVSAEDTEEFLVIFKKIRLICPIIQEIPVDNEKNYPDLSIVLQDGKEIDIWHHGAEYEEPWNFFYRLDGTVYYASGAEQAGNQNAAVGNQLAAFYNELRVRYKSTLAELSGADGTREDAYGSTG